MSKNIPTDKLKTVLRLMEEGYTLKDAAEEVGRTKPWFYLWLQKSQRGEIGDWLHQAYQAVPAGTCDLCGGGIPRQLSYKLSPSRYKTVEIIAGTKQTFYFCCKEHKQLWDKDAEFQYEAYCPKLPRKKMRTREDDEKDPKDNEL